MTDPGVAHHPGVPRNTRASTYKLGHPSNVYTFVDRCGNCGLERWFCGCWPEAPSHRHQRV